MCAAPIECCTMAADLEYIESLADLKDLEKDRAYYDVGELEYNMANPLAGWQNIDRDQEEAAAKEAQRVAEEEWPSLAESQEHRGKLPPEEMVSNKRRRKQSSPRKWVSNNDAG